ncbi:MAG: hypothetical protein IJD06_00510 [Clostridia bacterium]|nr:hypothetical protein [Clostridia bacterium]
MPKKTGHCNNYISQNAHFQEGFSNFPWAKCRYVKRNFVELSQKDFPNKKNTGKWALFSVDIGEKRIAVPFSGENLHFKIPENFSRRTMDIRSDLWYNKSV